MALVKSTIHVPADELVEHVRRVIPEMGGVIREEDRDERHIRLTVSVGDNEGEVRLEPSGPVWTYVSVELPSAADAGDVLKEIRTIPWGLGAMDSPSRTAHQPMSARDQGMLGGVILIVGGILIGVIGGAAGNSDVTVFGVLFFVLGMFVFIISNPNMALWCPHCERWVAFFATVCHHCGRDIRSGKVPTK